MNNQTEQQHNFAVSSNAAAFQQASGTALSFVLSVLFITPIIVIL